MLDCVINVTDQRLIFQKDTVSTSIDHINLTIYHSPESTIGVINPWHLGNNVFCLETKTEKGFETMLVRLKMGGWL